MSPHWGIEKVREKEEFKMAEEVAAFVEKKEALEMQLIPLEEKAEKKLAKQKRKLEADKVKIGAGGRQKCVSRGEEAQGGDDKNMKQEETPIKEEIKR